jgi:hypothetical protein
MRSVVRRKTGILKLKKMTQISRIISEELLLMIEVKT